MNHKGATHFTWEQRLTLERMIKKGFSKPHMAEALGKCERSIYYEIGRGMCEQITTDLEKVERYCPEVAERKYREFLAEKGPDLKIGHDHQLVRKNEELIVKHKFSSGAALAFIRNGEEEYDTEICETTLYNYIYRGDVFLVDNGCEFQDFEGIEIAHRRKRKRTIVFFCHPYSAYERGSNENMNRLIRRFFPKGTNFDEVTKEQVAEAERWINNYPRKLLGWKSANDIFREEAQAA